VAARCILDALGHSEPEEIASAARAYVGAMILVDAARELTALRKILIKALSNG